MPGIFEIARKSIYVIRGTYRKLKKKVLFVVAKNIFLRCVFFFFNYYYFSFRRPPRRRCSPARRQQSEMPPQGLRIRENTFYSVEVVVIMTFMHLYPLYVT